jgi:hypothetical protein
LTGAHGILLSILVFFAQNPQKLNLSGFVYGCGGSDDQVSGSLDIVKVQYRYEFYLKASVSNPEARD